MNNEKSNSSRKWNHSEISPKSIVKPPNKCLSPLERFRLQIDAELDDTGKGHCPTAARRMEPLDPEFLNVCPVRVQDSEDDSEEQQVENISDEFEKSKLEEAKAATICDESSLNNDETSRNSGNIVFTKESWLKCKFPFKKCCKVMFPTKKNPGLEDMSTIAKDKFFKNTEHSRNSISSRGSNSPTQNGYDLESKMHGLSVKEDEKNAKNRRKSAVVGCLGAASSPKKRLSTEKEKSEKFRRNLSKFQNNQPNYYPSFCSLRAYIPEPSLPSSGDQSKSHYVKRQPSYATVFKKVIMMADPWPDVMLANTTASTESSSQYESSVTSSGSGRRGGTPRCENTTSSNNPGAKVRSKEKRKKAAGGESPTPCGTKRIEMKTTSGGGAIVRSAGMYIDRRGQNPGNQQSMRTTDGSLREQHQGFTAFVPFQGFDVFSNHSGGGQRTNPSQLVHGF